MVDEFWTKFEEVLFAHPFGFDQAGQHTFVEFGSMFGVLCDYANSTTRCL